MFRMFFASVGITPPDFGSRREEIVPPVIMKAMFGSFELLGVWDFGFRICGADSRTLAFRISDSLIPML